MSKKDNLLVHKHPEIAAQFHPNKNGNLKVEELTFGSSKTVWWICSKNINHEWETTVATRTGRDKTGCPYCAGQKVCIDNCLATLHPDIAKQWNYDKNNELTPFDVTGRSGKKAWWKCNEGHEWESDISSRTDKRKAGCPYCSGHLPTSNNNLAFTHPQLIKEWDYEKNGNKNPSDFMRGSHEKVWWKCKNGHKYQASINNRSKKNGTGCPECDKSRHTSFPEQVIFYYIKKMFPDTKNRVNFDFLSKMEIDIYIPSLNFAIEYDGEFHKRKDVVLTDERKNKLMRDNNIKFIRVRLESLPHIENHGSFVLIHKNKYDIPSLSKCIKEILELISDNQYVIDIDIEKDKSEIYQCMYEQEVENSLLKKHPEIAEEWHPTKNGSIIPSNVPKSSRITAWWLGKCGHEWDAVVYSRTSGRGCPYCSGNKLSKENSLATLYPNIASEWHPTKNGKLTPHDVMAGTSKRVWWLCPSGHEYEAYIYSRTGKEKSSCQSCSKRKATEEFNLEKLFPNISIYWDTNKNNELNPSNVTPYSGKITWWKKGDEEWQEKIRSAIRNKKLL